MTWILQSGYEYEVNSDGERTGWFRLPDGQQDDGSWPAWRHGETRYL